MAHGDTGGNLATPTDARDKVDATRVAPVVTLTVASRVASREHNSSWQHDGLRFLGVLLCRRRHRRCSISRRLLTLHDRLGTCHLGGVFVTCHHTIDLVGREGKWVVSLGGITSRFLIWCLVTRRIIRSLSLNVEGDATDVHLVDARIFDAILLLARTSRCSPQCTLVETITEREQRFAAIAERRAWHGGCESGACLEGGHLQKTSSEECSLSS